MTPGRPERIETVLLDAGGVLLDLDYAYLRRLLDARGVEITIEALSHHEARARTEVERRVRDGARPAEMWRDYFRHILGWVGLVVDEHEAVIDSLWEAHQRIGLWTVPTPGGPATVERLKADGLTVGVVSNAEGRVERDLYAAGYDGLLDTVVDSHVVGVEKPDPKIFEIAFERLGADPATTVFVGDVPAIDVSGARAAGMFALLLDRHDLYPESDAPRLRTVRELLDWLP